MNDVISLGSHRILKRITVETSRVNKGDTVLDLAGGTGDLTRLFSRKTGPEGNIYLCDINPEMLKAGQERLSSSGLEASIHYMVADAEKLPFPDNFFDCVTIGYGLRNFTNKEQSLSEVKRVLKKGGSLLILEFSKPTNPIIDKASRAYSRLWPSFGKVLVGDGAPYRYLVESIQMHPDQQTLREMIEKAGLSQVSYTNFFSGVCALHRATKL